MTPELKIMMEEWLISGSEVQRRHAKHRLSLEYPSLIQQAKNAAAAAGAVVSSVVRGEAIHVSEEEQDRRLDICHNCLPPEGFWDASQERCSKCGCFGQWKTWLASQKCPVGKW